MTDENSKVKKYLNLIVRGLCTLPFAWLIILDFLMSREDNNGTMCVFLLLLFVSLTLLSTILLKKVDAKVRDKKFYIMFFIGSGIFIFVSGLLLFVFYFFAPKMLIQISEFLAYIRTLVYICLHVFFSITLFLWAIKQIRFRWVILSWMLFIPICVVYFVTYSVMELVSP